MMNHEYRYPSCPNQPLSLRDTPRSGFGAARPLIHSRRTRRRNPFTWSSISPVTAAESEPLWQTVLGCLVFAALYGLLLVAR